MGLKVREESRTRAPEGRVTWGAGFLALHSPAGLCGHLPRAVMVPPRPGPAPFWVGPAWPRPRLAPLGLAGPGVLTTPCSTR